MRLVLALLAVSCRAPTFACDDNTGCDLAPDGFCDATTRRCAYADDGCPAGARFSRLAGNDAERCVPPLPFDEPVAVAQRIAVGPTIDGDPRELQLGPPLLLGSSFGVEARLWFRFDDSALYVGAVVVDPQLEATKLLEDELWLEDGVELMFDTAHDRANAMLPRVDDYKFIVTALNARGTAWGGMRPHHAWDHPFDSAVIVDGTLNQTSDADSGYTLELSIPWSVGIAPPHVGTAWGLNAKVNDRYAGEARSSLWRTDGGFNNPAHAGTLVFADGAPPEVLEDRATPIDDAPPFVEVRGRVVADSGNFDPEQPLANLFDGCLDTAPRCAAGAEARRFTVTLDLGAVHELHGVRLFGDARHDWTSGAFSVRTRIEADDAWVDVVDRVPARVDDWVTAELANARARFVEVEVEGADPGVEARELQLFGRPTGDMR